VHWLVTAQNNKIRTVHAIKKIQNKKIHSQFFFNLKETSPVHLTVSQLALTAMSVILLTLCRAVRGTLFLKKPSFLPAATEVTAGGLEREE